MGCSLLLSHSLIAAPPTYRQSSETQAAQNIQSILSAVKHEVSNHESEIRMIEEKLNNQEETIETLRQHMVDSTQLHKDIVKDNSSNLGSKIESLDSKAKGVIADLGLLKNHANESSVIFGQYKEKINGLESDLKALKSQISHLESAVRSLMDIMQVKDSAVDTITSGSIGEGRIYRVQSGDTLEKIAKNQKTTIQALKERNNLAQDKIIVGQKLVIP